MKLLILLLSLVSIKSFAAAPSLSDIDAGDFEKRASIHAKLICRRCFNRTYQVYRLHAFTSSAAFTH